MTSRTWKIRRPGVDKTALRSMTPFFVVLVACLAYLFALLQPSSNGGARQLGAAGLVLCALSLFTFFHNGGKVIVSSSVLSYSILMFAGFPVIYSSLGLYGPRNEHPQESLLVAVSLAFFLQVLVYLAAPKPFLLEDTGAATDREPVPPAVISSMAKWSLSLSLIMFVAFGVARTAGLGVPTAGFGWLAVVFCSAVAFDLTTRKARPLGVLLLLAMVAAVYGADIGGFGRLHLAAVGLSIGVAASLALRTWWIKIAIGVLTPPALIYLVNQRLEYLQNQPGREVNSSEGIGSVVGPFHSAARIVEALQEHQIDLALGSTVLIAVLVWIPRSIWPEKPAGFGREIVEITQPHLVSTLGHSDAGTVIGEAVWNFGFWGAPLFLLGVALIARFLDRQMIKQINGPRNMKELVQVLLFSVLAGGWLNVVWGGAFTYTSRLMFPIVLLLVIMVIVPGKKKPILSPVTVPTTEQVGFKPPTEVKR